MSRLRSRTALVLAAACLSLSACASDTAKKQDSEGTSSAGAAAGQPAGAPAGGPTAYPLTLENCGKKYTFAKPPSRVVIMSGGSVAEVSSMLALGLGDRIVANAQSYGGSDEPGRADAVAALPTGGIKMGDMQDIPREAMLAQRPDFVLSTYGGGFASESGFATREDLAAVGANTYVPRATCGGPGSVAGTQTIEDSYRLLRDLGRIFDVADRAEQLIAASRQQIAAVAAKVQGRAPAPKVMLIIPGMNMGSAEFSSIGANGIWNDIIGKAGGVNAFADSTKELFANLSKEQVAAAEVDAVIIVGFMNPAPDADAAKLFARFPQWAAAKNNRYVVLTDSAYLGPNNATAVARLARLLHPQSF